MATRVNSRFELLLLVQPVVTQRISNGINDTERTELAARDSRESGALGFPQLVHLPLSCCKLRAQLSDFRVFALSA